MIIAELRARRLTGFVRRAARPDEDVVAGSSVSDALRRGFPRAMVVDRAGRGAIRAGLETPSLPTLVLDEPVLTRWDEARRVGGAGEPPEPERYVALRIRAWLERSGGRPSWVDLCLRDLGRAAGRPLPPALRGMVRRVLEFPSRYRDLKALGSIGGLTAGALKARFRRRGLPSPYSYLRWLRCVAAGHILSDPAVTTLVAAHRMDVSSSGNLSRAVQGTTGLTPTLLRTEGGRERLLTGMVEELLGAEALEAWEDLDSVFVEVA